jgi:predicted Zn-dependent protease
VNKKWPLALCSICLGALVFTTPSVPIKAAPALPRLGESGALDLAAERQLGERIAQAFFRDPDYIDDPVLGDHLQAVWQPLLASARASGELAPELAERFAWRLMLARDASVNAFALPGGYLGVHLGLLATVATPDELASVLAHELTHVSQRHISRLVERQEKQTPLLVAAMVLGALAASASKNADVVQAAVVGGQAVAAQTQLNFSRDMEREADRVGYTVMTGAGFDGGGFASMFDKLQQASRLNDDGAFPYLRSHPLTTERIADMQARRALPGSAGASGAPPETMPAAPPVSVQRHALMAARARVMAEPSVARWRAWLAEANALGAALSGHTVPQAAVRYAGAVAALRLKQPGDAWRCVQGLIRAVPHLDASATQAAHLLALEVWLAPGGGAALSDKVLQAQILPWAQAALHAPGLGPRVLGAQTLLALGRAAEVTDPLQLWLADHPGDALAWQVLGQAWQARDHPLRAIRAEAEARVVQFDLGGAIDRLTAARDLGRQLVRTQREVDHVELSIIDARYRELVQQQREQLRDPKR